MTTTDTPDVWHVPPAPQKTLAEVAACYTPAQGYATIVVRPDGVELGDVVDHTAGLMVVTEITRRTGPWTLAGYNVALPYRVPNPDPDGWPRAVLRPLISRDVIDHQRIRIRRPATHWQRLPGHTKRVTSHNPVKSGCYTLIGGWDAACSCGWALDAPARSRYSAGEAYTQHRADAITQATRDAYGLDAIERLEQQLGDVLPWRWDHGAQAQLHGLTTAQALDRLTPWADALGATIEHWSEDQHGLSDPHFLWVDSRATENETVARLDIRAYPQDGPATAGGAPSADLAVPPHATTQEG